MADQINEIYAFTYRDKDGYEWICPAPFGAGTGLITDDERLGNMKRMAKIQATNLRRPLTLVKFSNREEIEIITGE
jgi:hypothetical protein